MNKFLLFLHVSLLIGCSGRQKNSPSIYFAGEIVNPKNDSVVLYKDDNKICSSKLDANNRFEFKLDESAEEGLYYFQHYEQQYVYLEKGDSILVRLNTSDFDESLVFEGKGQEINNFLLEMYLIHEHEEGNIVNKFYRLEPNDFLKKVDSLNTIKQALLLNLKTESSLTDNAFAIAKACIDYTSYLYKEKYPRRHRSNSMTNESMAKLPEDFYSFQKNVSYKEKKYTYLRPYYKYMINHFRSMSYINCKSGCEVNGNYYKNQLHFNEHQLLLIDSLVDNKELKDNLERNVAFYYLLRGNDNEKNNTLFIEKFTEIAQNNKHISEIEALHKNINSIRKDKPVPMINVINFTGDNITLKQISEQNNKVIYYFWVGEYSKHFKSIMKRVKHLENEHPDFTFIGISLKTDAQQWKTIVVNNKLDQKKQFRAPNLIEFNDALIINGRMNKAVITDKGFIVDAFGDMYDSF